MPGLYILVDHFLRAYKLRGLLLACINAHLVSIRFVNILLTSAPAVCDVASQQNQEELEQVKYRPRYIKNTVFMHSTAIDAKSSLQFSLEISYRICISGFQIILFKT